MWQGPPKDGKVLYLTFDDGPIPTVTPWVLDQLGQYNAKATFFCVGDNVRKNPIILTDILASKHSVGGHTMQHKDAWRTASNTYLKNVFAVDKYLPNTLFRPPYGHITPKLIKEIKPFKKIVMWSLMPGDFDVNKTGETCLKNLLPKLQNRDIIVLHDSLKAWPRLKVILPKLLDFGIKNGFKFDAL
jgi:peptidoglycan-N-acetylglucosamine deacetylase